MAAEPLDIIDSNVERLSTKLTNFSSSLDASIDSVIEQIKVLQRELLLAPDVDPEGDLSVIAVVMWEKLVEQWRKLSSRVVPEHREFHCYISRCGREIERSFFTKHYELCQRIIDYENDPVLSANLNSLIMQHMLLVGLFEGAEKFSSESNVECDEDTRQFCLEVESVLSSLRKKDLEPALEWCRTHAKKLEKIGSILEFNLHKLKFIEMMSRGVYVQTDTLSYARVFQDFAGKHSADIKSLMGALLYIPKGLEHSPYKSLHGPALWNELCELFIKEACLLLGLPSRSPLGLILHTGTKGLPALLNIKQIMQHKQSSAGHWTGTHHDELPIHIEIDEEQHFHSIFSCPILRQQTTERNPPMRLLCGHVISKEALHKLATNNKLKCPYCPQESIVSETRQLYF